MGCTGSSTARPNASKIPSDQLMTNKGDKNKFGRIEGLSIEDFSCVNQQGVSFIKHSGEIMGQQFIVECCDSSNIFLLDHIASITIDSCKSCFIVTGPVSSSLFLRDCKNCTLITVCQQIRLRNCVNISKNIS